MWYVYIARCSDNSLYTGITTNVDRRIIEHNSHKKGAKYTRIKRPVKLVYFEKTASRSTASKREVLIKRLSRNKKIALSCIPR